MKNLIDRVWEYSLNNPQGFTLDLETFESVKFGICVAYKETQNSHDKESLEKVIHHATTHNKILGGWLNIENNKFYFDSVRIFKNLEQALEFAKEQEQLAIFDLTNLKEINL